MTTIIVTFHIERSDRAADSSSRRPLIARLDDAWNHGWMLKNSIDAVLGEVEFVLLTDRGTTVPDGIFDRVIRFDLDLSAMMFERMRVQLDYLRTLRPAEGTVLFLDTDMLVTAPWVTTLDVPYAVALSIRHKEVTLTNGGFILVNLDRLDEAITVWERAVERYRAAHWDQRAWWGDQLVWDDLLLNIGRSPGLVARISSDRYNYSPSYLQGVRDLLRLPASVGLIHFKGARKRLMPAFHWRYFRRARRPSRDTRLVLGSLLFAAKYAVQDLGRLLRRKAS